MRLNVKVGHAISSDTMTHRRRTSLFDSLLSGLVSLLASCTSLPEYAQPSGRIIEAGAYTATDVTRYRELSRGDFRAKAAPRRIAANASEVGAFTCANIVPDSFESEFAIVSQPGSGRYVARLPGAGFHAVMDRECSWWNPKPPPLPRDYILQHEQIHFAIVELQARRLTREVRELQRRGETPQSAADGLQSAFDSAVETATDAVVERTTRFDEDTSFGYNPERQAQWYSQVRAELASGH